MKEEALRRLEKLQMQIEEKPAVVEEPVVVEKPVVVENVALQQAPTEDAVALAALEDQATQEALRRRMDRERQPEKTVLETPRDRLDLLEDTRWKIVWNIGREPGTWMPDTWAASGTRLRFQVLVDFTSDPLYESEDFFLGIAGCRKLNVVEAWTLPSGTEGRHPVKVQATGGYKVLKGHGPMGTDVVRLYVELLEPVTRGDVKCPTGRIYGTCGYFPTHAHKGSDGRSEKDFCADEYHKAITKYENLRIEADNDQKFGWDQIKRMKDIYVAKTEAERLAKELQQARQREPDRNQLRMSRRGDVALSKEGGVCCKVRKGLTLEYHILGRMEVGSVERRDEHEEYEELVHKLHP